jgi:hypothetical protein
VFIGITIRISIITKNISQKVNVGKSNLGDMTPFHISKLGSVNTKTANIAIARNVKNKSKKYFIN